MNHNKFINKQPRIDVVTTIVNKAKIFAMQTEFTGITNLLLLCVRIIQPFAWVLSTNQLNSL